MSVVRNMTATLRNNPPAIKVVRSVHECCTDELLDYLDVHADDDDVNKFKERVVRYVSQSVTHICRTIDRPTFHDVTNHPLYEACSDLLYRILPGSSSDIMADMFSECAEEAYLTLCAYCGDIVHRMAKCNTCEEIVCHQCMPGTICSQCSPSSPS